MADQPDRIQWHPGFYGAAELELRANADDLIFMQEHSLSKEQLRADLLIIRKKPEVQIVNEIGKIFRGYNITANRSLYDDLRKEDIMCEALEDLMKDVIEERVNEAVSQAVKLNTDQVTKRVAEEKDREMAVKLLGQGMSLNTIADLIGRSRDVILQWVSPASQV